MKIPTMTFYDFINLLSVSSWTMGVLTLLTRLAGGDKELSDFAKLKIGDEVIAFDAAGADNDPTLERVSLSSRPRISITASSRKH